MENEKMIPELNEEDLTLACDDSCKIDAEPQSDDEKTDDACDENCFTRKCREIRDAWKDTACRIAEDFKAADGNPYIKETTTHKIELYRNRREKTPIDSFECEQTKEFSARALAIAGGAALVLLCVTGTVMKKMFR